MTKLNKTNVKKTLVKLNLDAILGLLVSCKKDYQLFSGNDVNSPRKELSIHRQALIDYIVDSKNEEIYKKAQVIAGLSEEHDKKIQSIKEELKPIKADMDAKKEELNSSVIDKELAVEQKVNELHDSLDEVALNKLADYNTLVEKMAVKSKNKKQMEKGKKEYSKGLIAASIEGVTEEFAAAMEGTTNFTLSFIAKTHARIKEHKEAGRDLNTVAGINTINQNFDREWKIERTNIINKAKLNPDWKQAEAGTCQSEEVSDTKLLMPANSEALAIAA